MRSFDSQFGLGFLLSFGALPIAGCPGEDDDDTGATSPTSLATATVTATATETDATASDGTAGTDPTASSDPTAGTDPTLTTTPTTDDPSETDADTGITSVTSHGTETGADTGELPPACDGLAIPPGCQAYADKLTECYPRYARYYQEGLSYCACQVSYYLEMYGVGCGAAYDDFYACIGSQSCEVIMGEMPYCETESMALDTACDFGDTTGANTDGG